MALLAYLLLFLALAGHSSATYCICKDGLSDSVLQKAIDYACGNGADCSPILQSGVCYSPNTVKDHCNYAVNSYFQKKGQATGTCDFAGAASPATAAPQQASSTCVYPSSTSTSTTPTSTTPTSSTPTGTGTTPTGTGTTPTSTGTGAGTTGTTTTPSVFNTPTTGLGPSAFDQSDGVALQTTMAMAVAIWVSGLMI